MCSHKKELGGGERGGGGGGGEMVGICAHRGTSMPLKRSPYFGKSLRDIENVDVDLDVASPKMVSRGFTTMFYQNYI